MPSPFEILKRELIAREFLKKYISKEKPFQSNNLPIEKLSQGTFPIGIILPYNISFHLSQDDLRLITLVGNPGQGKTHLARLLASMLMKSNFKLKIFTRKVHEFRDLLLLQNDFYDLEAKDIRLSPFYPPYPSITQRKWNEIISSCFQDDMWLKYSSGINLSKILNDFSEQHPYSFITPSRVLQFINQGKRSSYKKLDLDEKVRNRLEALTTGEANLIFNQNETFSFSFYASSNINFNLSSLNAIQVLSSISIFITMLIEYKRASKSLLHDCLILDDFNDLLAEVKLS